MITFRKMMVVLLSLFGVLILAILASLSVGSAKLPPGEIVRVLFRAFSQDWSDPAQTVILALRLPRTLLAAFAGAGLAVAGAAFQALTRNPLADPFLLGVSSGAAFGVVVAQTFGLSRIFPGSVGSPLFAFLGALLSTLGVYLIASSDGRLPIQTLLLSGVIVGLFFSSAITLFISFASASDLPGILHWLLGSLGPIDYGPLILLLGCLLVGMGMISVQAKSLNLLALGEEAALQLGVEGERVKRIVFVSASLLVGTVVAFSGSIGFVGLIVPHTIRMLFGPDNRLLIPASALSGAGFLVLADSLARTIVSPAEIPVGVITSLCGAPFFVYLLRKRYRSAL
ncbi:MAG: FecCD family ABC transporter permease [Candidatus Methylomirabilales bacterium]